MTADKWITLANLIILILSCFLVWPIVKLYVTIFTCDMAIAFKIILSAVIGIVIIAVLVYGISLLRDLGLFCAGGK